ncbi:MAG: VWA domain-containing protein [Gammaproteobacteria bacterium]|nr:VWA domain-containing protein [Gammaproteobacteria bacterium]MBQ0838213.1 VWA domain-containing protein [Gammaproteobacteria bacterium]
MGQLSSRLKTLGLWLALLLISLGIHLVLTWQASLHILTIEPLTANSAEEVEILLDLAEPQAEKEELVFEEAIEFEPPPVLVPTAALAPPPPEVNLAMEAAAGGESAAGFSAPLLSNIATAGEGLAGFGSGVGTGLGQSANQFAAYVQGLRETGLDVVFVVDSTGSMDWVIDEVQRRIVDIVDVVRPLVPVSRFGVVAYRDVGSPSYVTQHQVLTFSLNKLSRFLNNLSAEGGGDFQEAVYEGMKVATEKSGWRLGAKKVIILIGDAPPHQDSFQRLLAVNREFASGHGQISTLDVSHHANPAVLEAKLGRPVNRAFYTDTAMLDYQLMAEAGGGTASTLDGDVHITRQLVSLIMGGQFAREMALLLEGF